MRRRPSSAIVQAKENFLARLAHSKCRPMKASCFMSDQDSAMHNGTLPHPDKAASPFGTKDSQKTAFLVSPYFYASVTNNLSSDDCRLRRAIYFFEVANTIISCHRLDPIFLSIKVSIPLRDSQRKTDPDPLGAKRARIIPASDVRDLNNMCCLHHLHIKIIPFFWV